MNLSSTIEKTHEISTEDTYEAAYYVLHGARLDHIKWINSYQYVLFMINVDAKAIKQWSDDSASVNPKRYAEARKNLKKRIKKVPQGVRPPSTEMVTGDL